MSLNYDHYLYKFHSLLYQRQQKSKEIKSGLTIHEEVQDIYDLRNGYRVNRSLVNQYEDNASYERASYKFKNISERLWWLSQNLSRKLFKLELDIDYDHDKKDLKDEISEMHCLYQIKLEEKNNPLNQKFFEDIYTDIRLKAKYVHLGYKLDYMIGSKEEDSTILFNLDKGDIKKAQIQS